MSSNIGSKAYSLNARVWLYEGNSGWYFITIENADASEIKKEYIWPRRGFGSIPVNVAIGKTFWKTSIFPDKKGTYLLPLKKEVRTKENIKAGDTIEVEIEVIT